MYKRKTISDEEAMHLFGNKTIKIELPDDKAEPEDEWFKDDRDKIIFKLGKIAGKFDLIESRDLNDIKEMKELKEKFQNLFDKVAKLKQTFKY